MSIRLACRPGGLLLLLVLSAGCSSYGNVSGKVSFKGETLGGGKVLFVAPGQKTVSSPIAPDGTYTIANIPTGTVQIAVETESARPVEADAMKAGVPQIPPDANLPPEAAKSMYKSGMANKGKYVWIPEGYGDPEKSGLTLEVTGGNQPYDIELK
jgi:hypothetical protein